MFIVDSQGVGLSNSVELHREQTPLPVPAKHDNQGFTQTGFENVEVAVAQQTWQLALEL
jgi:hypothetical protein